MIKNILIVDRSTTILKILSLALRFKGYNAKVFDNGKEALLALEKEKFDMAVIDLMIPVVNGCEILARIRNDERLKDIPAVILTEANNEKMRNKALSLGANCLIEKPFQPKEFMNKVEELLKD